MLFRSLHVYQRSSKNVSEHSFSVPFHKDRGMVLYVTHFSDLPVIIKGKDGAILNTDSIPIDSIIVIIGSAISEWLLEGTDTSHYFHAASHGVPSLSKTLDSRVIVARMKVTHE